MPTYASDVWGLGATLFHAVAGHKPFATGDPDADDVRVRFPQLTSAPRRLPDDVPAEVAKVIDACLQVDPEARPLPADVSGRTPAGAGAPAARVARRLQDPRLSRIRAEQLTR